MLGTDLSLRLSKDHEVLSLGLRAPEVNLEHFEQDLSDSIKTRNIIQEVRPELIIHTAAMTDVDGCESRREDAFSGNVQVTRNIVDSANEVGAFVIFFSTDYVFSGEKSGEYLESDTTSPINYYGQTKLEAEQYIQKNAKKFIIFRISWLYGIYGKCFPKAILNKAKEVSELRVVSDQYGRPTSAFDIAEVFEKCLQDDAKIFKKNSGEIFNLVNEGQCSWADFSKEILRVARIENVKVQDVDSNEFMRPAKRPKNSVLSREKTKKKLGIDMQDWKISLADFMGKL